MCTFFVRIRPFQLTLDVIDALCLVYSNFRENKVIFFKLFTGMFINFQYFIYTEILTK